MLTEIALATERIRLVSGVLSVWAYPGTLAMTAATLDEISGGRYVLGLGASTAALTEGFHDVPFVHPADKLAHTVTAVRALLAGEPARLLNGDPHARPLRLGVPPAPPVPIWVAALGPRSLRVAAEQADGWFPALVALDQLGTLVAQLRSTPAAGEGRPRPLTVAAGPLAVVGENPGPARDIAAACIAWYVTAMGDVYAESLARQGYAAEVAAVRAANPRPRPDTGRIPGSAEVLLHQLAAIGDPGQVRGSSNAGTT